MTGRHAEPPRTVRLLGQELDAVTLDEAVDQVVALVGQGGSIVTMNVDHAVLLERHVGLQDAYRAAAHRYADGMPLVWLSRLVGRPLPERVTGADLVPAVLARAEAVGLSVHLVGGSPQAALAAREAVLARHPLLRWTGQESPERGFERDPIVAAAVVAAVSSAAPDVVLVCLGAPKQEEWALRHGAELPGSVLLCAGAAVDFLAGTAVRAPQWVQRAGMEWLFRLLKEPGRLWRRYLVQDRAFFRLAVREVLSVRRG
jgi:N-acetylglucosaminyldiphosphoundecaprenol N-acetyl-beta-D-mannosaminyltransferase